MIVMRLFTAMLAWIYPCFQKFQAVHAHCWHVQPQVAVQG